MDRKRNQIRINRVDLFWGVPYIHIECLSSDTNSLEVLVLGTPLHGSPKGQFGRLDIDILGVRYNVNCM